MAIEVLQQEDPGQDHVIEREQVVTTGPAEEADADEIALASAEAELAAEEEATAATTAEQGEGDAPAAEATPAAAAAPAADQVTVPKARLDQEAAKTRTAKEETAYWRGKAEALETVAKAGTTAAPVAAAPVKTPQEIVKDLRATKLAGAKAYEDGEITLVEWTQKADEIEDQIAEIRANGVAHVATQAATDPMRDPGVRQSTSALETDVERYPVLAITKPDGTRYYDLDELRALEPIARAEMRNDGKPFNPRDGQSLVELRTRVAELAQHNFGHRVPADVAAAALAARKPAAAVAAKTPAAPAASAKPGITPAQRAAKLALAERMPPDLTRAGSAGGSLGPSESQILELSTSDFENMTDAEIRALERQVS